MPLHRGRVATPIKVLGIRVLEREDLLKLKVKRTRTVVDRFRDPHHMVARLLAWGKRPNEVAVLTGYSHSRIATLQADPAFQNLIAQKRGEVDEVFRGNMDSALELMTSNMLKAQRMIAEKLDKADEEEDLPSFKELVAISADAADRVGYGKKTTNVNYNVDFGKTLEQAIRRSANEPARLTPKLGDAPTQSLLPAGAKIVNATAKVVEHPRPSPPGEQTNSPRAQSVPVSAAPFRRFG